MGGLNSVNRMRILAIDDERTNRSLLEALLVPQGYEVELAADGAAGLAVLAAQKIDLVLLDVMMPGLDGFAVCRRIKSGHVVPVIMLTALNSREDMLRGLEAGADDFVSKPFNQEELFLRVRNLLRLKDYQDTLADKVREKTRELEAAYRAQIVLNREMARRLLIAAEFRDDETGKHIIRVGRYSRIIAAHYGLDADAQALIEEAAPMHDIGKIGIPDSILHKPARLTDEEFAVVKTHADIGARILRGSKYELLQMAAEIAQNHHEKWDGSGYPGGRRGDAIPVSARITAVTDVFDALLSKRPYKPAFPWEKSVGIIREGAGGHFDPAAVAAFERGLVELAQVEKEYRDTGVKDLELDLAALESRR